MKRTTLSTLAAAISLALYGGSTVHAGCPAIAGNQATPFLAGQPNPNNGFAEFVTDSEGLALELCLDPANCFFDPVIAGNLFSEQIGFGAEAFWWLADAAISTTNAAGNPLLDAIVVMATEAAFLADPADGEQFPFTRLRIRLDVPQPGVYTVTHPYGTEEFTVTTVGAGLEVSTSADIQFTPGPTGGTTQNQGCVAPWLQWDPAESAPPAGFIGDGVTLHTVTGSPIGQNFFQVSAVDLNGIPIALDPAGNNTVSTDLFTVNGKLYDGTLATPMVSNRTTYERDAAAAIGQVDVFATAAQTATVSFNGGPNLPAGDIPLVGDDTDPRVAEKFFASAGLTPDASVVPPIVELNASDAVTPTDPTRLLRLVTDLVVITRAEYNLTDQTLSIEAVSTDDNLTPQLTVAEYGLPLPAQIVTAAPPARVNVTSAVGGTAEVQVAVIENIAPVANDDSVSTDEDTPASFDLTANDTDADGIDTATVTITGGPANGTAINNGDGTIDYTPNADFNGGDSLTYTVRDIKGVLSNEATVSITVNAVNDPPLATDDAASTDNQTAVIIDVLGNDSDVDIATNGDTLSVSAVDTTGTVGTVTNNGSNVTYTPAPGFTGIDTFTYTVIDSGGLTDTASVTVQVFEVNGAPTANDDSFTVAEDSGSTLLDVLTNDTDPETDPLTITAVTQPAAGTGSVVNNGSSVSFTPAANFNGATAFSYTIDDGNGNSDTANVTVDVTPVNDNPTAVGDTATTTSGTPVTINVLANDFDVDGDALSVSAVTSPTANGGTAVMNPDNSVTYTSAVGFSGPDSFDYTVIDGNGGSASATVAVDVSAVAGQVDLDISALRATGRVRGVGTVDLSLSVRLNSAVGGPRPATIVGVDQNGSEIYRQTLNVDDAPGRGSTTFNYPGYTTTGNEGIITWTATLVDDDPDVDQATTTTQVR